MAVSRARGCCGLKCVIIVLIVIFLILAISAVAINSVLHKSLAELGYADMDIMGTTPQELGLADTPLIDFIKAMLKLSDPNLTDFVTKPFGEQDISEVEDLFGGSGIENYRDLATQKAFISAEYITLKDTNLAYILDSAITPVSESTAHPEIAEVSIYKLDGKFKMRIVSYMEQNIQSDNSTLNSIFPSTIYTASVYDMAVDANGKLILVSNSISVNGVESEEILNLLFASLSQEDDTMNGMEFYNTQIANSVSDIIYNIGEITTANGSEGISESKLYLKTHQL